MLSSVWRSLLYALFLFLPLAVLGDDTLKTSNSQPTVLHFAEDVSQFSIPWYSPADTSLRYFHYRKMGLRSFSATLGNVDSPAKPLVFSFPSQVGFNLGIRSFDPYFLSPKGIKYYHVRKPFTQLHFLMGSKEQQHLDAIHSQNITPHWNAGLRIVKSASDGFFDRQKTSRANVLLHTNYQNRSGRYVLLANALYNQYKTLENGGITDDTLFELAPNELGTRVVHLFNADNETRSKSAYFKHFINLGKTTEVTAPGDTLPHRKVIPTSRFSHSFLFMNQWFRYQDEQPDTSFYNDFFSNTENQPIFDSLYYRMYENTLGWELLPERPEGDTSGSRRFGLHVWLRHQYLLYSQDTILEPMRNYFTGGRFILGNLRKLGMFIKGEYTYLGTNLGDYRAEAGIRWQMTKGWNLQMNGLQTLRTPDFMQLYTSSSHFSWDNNDFAKVNPTVISARLGNKPYGFWVEGTYHNIGRYIYYDAEARPKQLQNTVEIYRVSASQHVIPVRNLHLEATVHWQQTALADVIRLPKWMIFGSLWYENMLFKGKMQAQIGMDIFWNSAYSADSWMPTTRQFHLQNRELIGNYPFTAVYIAAKIKRVRLYFKTTHVNQGFPSYDYYMVPHYPMADRTFRLGINWTFLD